MAAPLTKIPKCQEVIETGIDRDQVQHRSEEGQPALSSVQRFVGLAGW